MRTRGHLMALLAAGLLCVAEPAAAQRQPPYVPVYQGLLPEGFQVQEGPFTPADLRGRTVVIVPSANLVGFIDLWAPAMAKMGSRRLAAQTVDGLRQASDPRNFSDQVAGLLGLYAAKVDVAEDLVAARDKGADYIVVVDYWSVWRMIVGRQRTRAGFHMLDRDLRQVLSFEHQVDTPLADSKFLDRNSGWDAVSTTMVAGLKGASEPVMAQARARLGAPAQ